MEQKGQKNMYVCQYGHQTVTVNAANGTTPFMILCPRCDISETVELAGKYWAFSRMYGIPQHLPAEYEWYKPSKKQAKRLTGDEKEHVKSGGLLMRKLKTTPEQRAAIVSANRMRELADHIANTIPGYGFALLVFPFHRPGISNYISNAQREDMIKALEETLARWKNQDDFPTPEEN